MKLSNPTLKFGCLCQLTILDSLFDASLGAGHSHPILPSSILYVDDCESNTSLDHLHRASSYAHSGFRVFVLDHQAVQSARSIWHLHHLTIAGGRGVASAEGHNPGAVVVDIHLFGLALADEVIGPLKVIVQSDV